MRTAEEILKEKFIHPLTKTERQWVIESMEEYANQKWNEAIELAAKEAKIVQTTK